MSGIVGILIKNKQTGSWNAVSLPMDNQSRNKLFYNHVDKLMVQISDLKIMISTPPILIHITAKKTG